MTSEEKEVKINEFKAELAKMIEEYKEVDSLPDVHERLAQKTVLLKKVTEFEERLLDFTKSLKEESDS